MDAPIPYPQPPLGGVSFVLRPFRAADFDTAVELAGGAGDALWIDPLPAADGPGMEAACEASRQEGAVLQLVIADPEDDAYLGEVSLVMLEPGTAELGCAVVRRARGRGIASSALGLLSTWALATLPLRRLQLTIDPRNLPALRLAEKAGYLREGLMRAYMERDGEVMDAVLFSRLPSDPAPA